jgi:hypothetical protein
MTSEGNARQILTPAGLSTNWSLCKAIYKSPLSRILTCLFSRTGENNKNKTKQNKQTKSKVELFNKLDCHK